MRRAIARPLAPIPLLLAALALFLSACGIDTSIGTESSSSPSGRSGSPVAAFAPTVAFLSSSADATATAGTYRFEMAIGADFDLDGVNLAIPEGTTLAVGSVDGELSLVDVDAGALFMAILDSSGLGESGLLEDLGLDLALTALQTPDRLYLTGPMFRTFAEFGGLLGTDGQLPPEASRLVNEWGFVDLETANNLATAEGQTALGESISSQQMDPAEWLDALVTAGDLSEGEPLEVRGIATRTLVGTVSLAAILEASGQGDISDIAGVDSVDPDTRVDLVAAVDDAGMLRRIEVNFDIADLTGPGEAVGTGSMQLQYDLFDYDDPSINIEEPDAAIDITGWLLED